jgi:hypothetical protein
MTTQISDEKDQHPAEHEALYHRQTAAEHGIAACRAALAAVTAGLCPHGVDWTNCHQHEETG